MKKYFAVKDYGFINRVTVARIVKPLSPSLRNPSLKASYLWGVFGYYTTSQESMQKHSQPAVCIGEFIEFEDAKNVAQEIETEMKESTRR